MLGLTLSVVVVLAAIAAVRFAARRFEARQRKLGRWDEYGPLVETKGPPSTVRGGRMNERLEVIGRWKGKVLRRRNPHEKP
jgi:hypothetical protein